MLQVVQTCMGAFLVAMVWAVSYIGLVLKLVFSGEKFSVTPLQVRPGGVNHNSFIVGISPPGAY